MAKKVFADNVDMIMAAQANGWQTHVHDGADADGHASLIDPIAHINWSTGVLNLAITGFSDLNPLNVPWCAYPSGAVDLVFPFISGTSNATRMSAVLTGAIPPGLLPYNQLFECFVFNNGARVRGALQILFDGVNNEFVWYVTSVAGGAFVDTAAGFAAGGMKGMSAAVIRFYMSGTL